MSRRAYRATRVNDVSWEQLARGKESLGVALGVDVGKFDLFVVCRWTDGRFERPWRVRNPKEIPALVALVTQIKAEREALVAMEPSGTYGDALRQALADKEIAVQRVSGKAAHDYAEVFDGVPSQHDGKDAAVVAELAALGKARPWAYQAADSWEEELTYWVEEMVTQRQIVTLWQGRLEGLLARHWPEASQVLKLSSGTLVRTLKRYGSPKALAEDAEAAKLQWAAWPIGSDRNMSVARRRRSRSCWRVQPVECAGVRVGQWQQRQIQDYAPKRCSPPDGESNRAQRRLRQLAKGHSVLEPQGKMVGVPTACVCLLGGGGGPPAVPCGGCLPQGDGVEPEGAEQREIPGRIADQQAGRCAGAAMAVFRGVAAGATVRRASLVRGQEGAPRRGCPAGVGGGDAEAGHGVASGGGHGGGVPAAAIVRSDRQAPWPLGQGS